MATHSSNTHRMCTPSTDDCICTHTHTTDDCICTHTSTSTLCHWAGTSLKDWKQLKLSSAVALGRPVAARGGCHCASASQSQQCTVTWEGASQPALSQTHKLCCHYSCDEHTRVLMRGRVAKSGPRPLTCLNTNPLEMLVVGAHKHVSVRSEDQLTVVPQILFAFTCAGNKVLVLSSRLERKELRERKRLRDAKKEEKFRERSLRCTR